MVRECFKYKSNIDATRMTNHEYTEYKQPIVSVTSEKEDGFMVIKGDEDFWMEKDLFNKLFVFSGEHIIDDSKKCPCDPIIDGELIIRNE